MNMVRELTQDEAIEMAESHWWEYKSDEEIVWFQLLTRRIIMPLSLFHQKLEAVLGRAVFTHEFALNYTGLINELRGAWKGVVLRTGETRERERM